MAPLKPLVLILAVVAVGLLAGIMLSTGMEQYSLRTLPENHWTLEHQSMDALFRRVMPAFFNITAALLIVAAVLSRGSSRWLFAAAALLIIISIGVTVRVEVPMNRAIAQWTPGAAPSDWMDIRERWLRNHLVRTISSILAFALAAAGLTRT